MGAVSPGFRHRRSRFVPTPSSTLDTSFPYTYACSTVPMDPKDAQMLDKSADPWWTVIPWLRRQHALPPRPLTLATQSVYFTSAFEPTAAAESTVPPQWTRRTSISPRYRESMVLSPDHTHTPISNSANHSKPLPSPPLYRESWVESPRTHALVKGIRDGVKRLEHEEAWGAWGVMQRAPTSPKSAPARFVRKASA